MAATRRFWPWVLVSTVRPTTTRRSLMRSWRRLVADELDAVGGRQDLERGDQAAAAVLALEVVAAERLGQQGRLELVLAVGDGVPPTILVVTPACVPPRVICP